MLYLWVADYSQQLSDWSWEYFVHWRIPKCLVKYDLSLQNSFLCLLCHLVWIRLDTYSRTVTDEILTIMGKRIWCLLELDDISILSWSIKYIFFVSLLKKLVFYFSFEVEGLCLGGFRADMIEYWKIEE